MSSTEFTQAESLHRLVKLAIDSGTAKSIAEAQAMFAGYRIAFAIDSETARKTHQQAVLLTGIALARRVFLGGVAVQGALDVPLTAPLPLGKTLGDAANYLGATIAESAASTPLVTIGGPPSGRTDRFHIRTECAGWRAGVVPGYSESRLLGADAIGPASMLAAGLAVNEAFSYVSTQSQTAGRRGRGLSLWSPSLTTEWTAPDPSEPELTYLPSRLWILGLGHLGQAYLWGLGLLEYPDPSELHLVLQDVDVITPSTESTSVLSEARLIGRKKTRAMAAWAESRGFSTAIHERLFEGTFRRQPSEPAVALCGLDNALGRRCLDEVGFDLVVEAGLGRGYRDFRTIRLHSLPGSRTAAELWPATTHAGEDLTDRPAYTRMLEQGLLDQCGMTLLAGRAVGAPFVGAVAASLALSEVLRFLHGGVLHQLVDLDLQSIEQRTVVRNPRDFHDLNPGFVISRRSSINAIEAA